MSFFYRIAGLTVGLLALAPAPAAQRPSAHDWWPDARAERGDRVPSFDPRDDAWTRDPRPALRIVRPTSPLSDVGRVDLTVVWWESRGLLPTATIDLSLVCDDGPPIPIVKGIPNDGHESVDLWMPWWMSGQSDHPDQLNPPPGVAVYSLPFETCRIRASATDHPEVAGLSGPIQSRSVSFSIGGRGGGNLDADRIGAPGDTLSTGVDLDPPVAGLRGAVVCSDGARVESTGRSVHRMVSVVLPPSFGEHEACHLEGSLPAPDDSLDAPPLIDRGPSFRVVEAGTLHAELFTPRTGNTFAYDQRIEVRPVLAGVEWWAPQTVYLGHVDRGGRTRWRRLGDWLGFGLTAAEVQGWEPGLYRIGFEIEAPDGRRARAMSRVFRILPPDADDEAVVAEVPQVFALALPSPNPTSAEATIALALPSASHVLAELFDVQGRRIAVLADGEQSAGTHQLPIDVSEMASGVYVVRVTAGADEATRTVTVVR